jgi:hypothetical protein
MARAQGGPPDWLKLIRLQQETLSRLRDDADNCKAASKAAKLRMETAQRDLETLVRDSKDGQLFGVVGVIVTDPKTGKVADYKSINEQLGKKADAMPEQGEDD